MFELDHDAVMTRGVRVLSLGCRLNAAEGETISRLATAAGLADAIVVNSCAVTNEAVRHTRQKIRSARRREPTAMLLVTGCAAQIDPTSFAEMAGVDAVIGNQEKLDPAAWRRLADLEKLSSRDKPILAIDDIMSVRGTANNLSEAYGERARAFLQIQNGCDHRCTFCVIPFGRGNARSAPISDVIEAAKRLTDLGRIEIVLTGVDLTSWGADLEGRPRLGQLISAVLDHVPELKRLRLSSIDGAEIDGTLLERIVGDTRLAPHLHLSLQSGDDLILKRMKRRHTRTAAIELCAYIKSRRPELALGADLIAGFPTETEEMFRRTRDLIDEAQLSYVHVFPYSARQGTAAARMPQLPKATIAARAATLREDAARAELCFLDQLSGRVETAVVEAGGVARLGNFALMRIDEGSPQAGEMVRVHITGRAGKMLLGTIIE